MDNQIPLLADSNSLELPVQSPDLLKEIRQDFIEHLPGIQRELNEYTNQKNWLALRALIHKILGETVYCGTPRLQASLRKLQDAAHQENIPSFLIDETNNNLELTLHALNNFS